MHTAAGRVGAMDVGFTCDGGTSSALQGAKAVYNLGADEIADGRSDRVRGLTATDSHTLTIALREPFAPFISILAMVNAKVVPREAVEKGDFGKNPVGTGPFRFRSWGRGEILLTANGDYFGGRPFLGSLNFRVYGSNAWGKVTADFEAGMLEQCYISGEMYDKLDLQELKKRYNFISKPGLNLVYVAMITSVAPFGDKRVRRAISHAVDVETIVRDITQQGSVPARGVLPPGIAGFDPQFRRLPYDPEKAGELLDAAGYPAGDDGVERAGGAAGRDQLDAQLGQAAGHAHRLERPLLGPVGLLGIEGQDPVGQRRLR